VKNCVEKADFYTVVENPEKHPFFSTSFPTEEKINK
jgi:hypothetical protein